MGEVKRSVITINDTVMRKFNGKDVECKVTEVDGVFTKVYGFYQGVELTKDGFGYINNGMDRPAIPVTDSKGNVHTINLDDVEKIVNPEKKRRLAEFSPQFKHLA